MMKVSLLLSLCVLTACAVEKEGPQESDERSDSQGYSASVHFSGSAHVVHADQEISLEGHAEQETSEIRIDADYAELGFTYLNNVEWLRVYPENWNYAIVAQVQRDGEWQTLHSQTGELWWRLRIVPGVESWQLLGMRTDPLPPDADIVKEGDYEGRHTSEERAIAPFDALRFTSVPVFDMGSTPNGGYSTKVVVCDQYEDELCQD